MPKIINHPKYKEELLLKCFELFARRGFDSITLKEIASELGISPGSLYYYFPAKGTILEEMFILLTRRDVNAMLSLFEESDTYKEKILKIFDYVAGTESYFQNLLLLTIDYFRFNLPDECNEKLNRYFTYYRDGIGSIIGLPHALSSMMILFLNGLVYNRLICNNMVSFEEQSSSFRRMIELYVDDQNISIG